MSARAFLGLSHTPLLGLNPVAAEVDRALQAGLAAAAAQARAFGPELIVLVGTDHYNAFYNELMPPFCIGARCEAIGDFQTPSGSLNVSARDAVALAEGLMEAGFDPAISHQMRADHGLSQPLQLLWGGLDTPAVLPIFFNAVAQPVVMRIRRCRALGQAIGAQFREDPRRILFIGSGGLSHEPPVPTLADPNPKVRERITLRQYPTPEERQARTERVMAAGMALATGDPRIKPLNPQWDDAWMNALCGDAAALDALCTMPEASIAEQGGASAHESKTWLIARSALAGDAAPACRLRHYQAIPEYIAGFGILFLQ